MTDLSVAAAEDEVIYVEQAIQGASDKVARLRDQIRQTEQAKAAFKDQLVEARRQVREAKKRDVTAGAETADGEGDV